MLAEKGATKLTTILPSAVFGPVLSKRTWIGSYHPGPPQGASSAHPPPGVLGRGRTRSRGPAHSGDELARGARPALHSRRRVHVVGGYPGSLRSGLGGRADKTPTRRWPDFVFRILSVFTPQLRAFTRDLGRRNELTSKRRGGSSASCRAPQRPPSSTAPRACSREPRSPGGCSARDHPGLGVAREPGRDLVTSVGFAAPRLLDFSKD